MNDPNGLVFYEGTYHLFYQYNPQANEWGHISWGHAVSRDLLRWEEWPVALPEHGGAMAFSGSAVVDWQNTSGFGQDSEPPLVAIYTARYGEGLAERQMQSLAFSNDQGRTWTFYEGNPVLDLGSKDFRDPKVFWHHSTQSWIMAVALPTERQIGFYASPDLKRWSHLDNFGPVGATGGVWECPDLFPLPIEDEPGETRWVLVVNLNPGGVAGGSGCQYFVGDFDGQRFVPESPTATASWVDFGPDFYAAVSWSDIPPADGRRILLGWMCNWTYCTRVPTTPWRGAMTIPRVLGLRRVAGKLRLIQRPVEELAGLRQTRSREFNGGTFAQANAWLAQQKDLRLCMDVEIMLSEVSVASRFTLAVHTGHEEFISIECDATAGQITVDRTRSGQSHFHAGFAGSYSAPLHFRKGRCALRVLLDASSFEVFAQDGEVALTGLFFPSGEECRLSFTASGSVLPTIDQIIISP